MCINVLKYIIKTAVFCPNYAESCCFKGEPVLKRLSAHCTPILFNAFKRAEHALTPRPDGDT